MTDLPTPQGDEPGEVERLRDLCARAADALVAPRKAPDFALVRELVAAALARPLPAVSGADLHASQGRGVLQSSLDPYTPASGYHSRPAPSPL